MKNWAQVSNINFFYRFNENFSQRDTCRYVCVVPRLFGYLAQLIRRYGRVPTVDDDTLLKCTNCMQRLIQI